MPFLEPGNERAIELDKEGNVTNRWRWEWLDEKTPALDGTPVPIREWCKKLAIPGVCLCCVCHKRINYGARGKKRLLDHRLLKDHKKAFSVSVTVVL